MAWTAGKLWEYFGLLGIASTVLGLVALLVLLAAWVSRYRPALLLAGLLLAGGAILLGRANSDRIATFLPDMRDQEARLEAMRAAQAARQAEKEAAARRNSPRAFGARQFAETDRQTRRILQQSAQPDPDEDETGLGDPDGLPAYLAGGKKHRNDGAVVEDQTLDTIGQDAAEKSEYRILPEADVYRADRWDRLNRRWLAGVFWAGLSMVGLAIVLWLRRLNRPFGTPWPLPLDGPWLRSLFAAPTGTYIQTDCRRSIAAHLRGIVRAGKTFLYIGPDDPLSGHRLGRLPGARPVEILHLGNEPDPPDPRFVLDLLWFNQAAAVVTDPSVADLLLDRLVVYLENRAARRAEARHLVHLVWHRPGPPPAAQAEQFLRLFARTGFCLDVICPAPPGPELAGKLDLCRPGREGPASPATA